MPPERSRAAPVPAHQDYNFLGATTSAQPEPLEAAAQPALAPVDQLGAADPLAAEETAATALPAPAADTPPTPSRTPARDLAAALREFAVEALAIHQEHRERDLTAARELALFALDEGVDGRRADSYRHRLARLDRKLARKENPQLFSS